MSRKPLLVVITGATASGKTGIAIDLALRLGTEIVSADSRQIYRGLPIITAAPTAEQLSRVRHHLVGTLPLDAYYSAAEYAAQARQIIDGLLEKHNVAIVCGGSMMYIDALLGGIDDIPSISPAVRTRVDAIANAPDGLEHLTDMLQRLDPEHAATVDVRNLRRVAHAVEVCLEAGVPYSSLLGSGRPELPFDVLMMAPEIGREDLYGRINARVKEMLAAGMEKEARAVYPLRGLNSLNTVGVKEWFTFFSWEDGTHAPSLMPSTDDGLRSVEGVCARIAKNTRVYAKKQLLWMRRYKNLRLLPAEKAVEEALRLVREF